MPCPAVSALGQHQQVSHGVTPLASVTQHLDDFQMDIGPSLPQRDRKILYFSDSWLSRAPKMNLTRPRARRQLGAGGWQGGSYRSFTWPCALSCLYPSMTGDLRQCGLAVASGSPWQDILASRGTWFWFC